MTMAIFVQYLIEGGDGDWHEVGPRLHPYDPPGSFSQIRDDRREVYVFGWRNDEPGVWRSVAGVDIEEGELREIINVRGMEKLSDLSKPYETEYRSLMGIPCRVQIELVHD